DAAGQRSQILSPKPDAKTARLARAVFVFRQRLFPSRLGGALQRWSPDSALPQVGREGKA
ncbi:hypothetical protein, partial [Mesorhizobium sp.]|uniref:hypothetical protein n=1 Tax=Mesorhizobium sp. TaxID=1871066 RepID=UPI0025C3408E